MINIRKSTASTIRRISRNVNMVVSAHSRIAMLIFSSNCCIYLKPMQNSTCSIIKQSSARLNKTKKATWGTDASMLIIDRIFEENLMCFPMSQWHARIGHRRISLRIMKMAVLKDMTAGNVMDGKNLIIIHLFIRLRVVCHKPTRHAKRFSIVLSITLLLSKGNLLNFNSSSFS